MFDSKSFDEITKKFADNLPEQFKILKNDIEKNFKNSLQSAFNKLDLVTREEFDVQSEVLVKTRTKLELLTKRVEELEKQVAELTSQENKA